MNITRAERRLLGRLAGSRRKSTGHLVRQLYLRGLLEESPADAAILIRIREGRGSHV